MGFGEKKRERETVRAANSRREEEEEGAGGWEWAVKQSAPQVPLGSEEAPQSLTITVD